MTRKNYYQRIAGDVKIIEGKGDAPHLKKEALFLGYYGNKLSELLREPGLKIVAIDEGTHLNAVGFPDSYEGEESKLCGIVSEDDMVMEEVLADLDWKKF